MKRFILILALAFVMPAFAEETKAPEMKHEMKPEMKKETREKMAQMFEKHAACLRSDKPMADCHKEMKSNCEAMGDDCPMRKMMDHDMGPGMGRGMGMGKIGKGKGKGMGHDMHDMDHGADAKPADAKK